AGAVCLLVTLLTVVGSVGWVLGDRVARKGTAEDKVREALEAAEPALRQGNPWDPVLISSLRKAEAQLDGGLLNPAWRQQVERLQKDVWMLAELEEARLKSTDEEDHLFDWIASPAQYVKAFQNYGIDMETLTPEEASASLRASAIRIHLVAGVDDWA